MKGTNTVIEGAFTLTNAVELGVNLIHEVTGPELSSDVLNDCGREQLGLMLLSRVRQNLANRPINN